MKYQFKVYLKNNDSSIKEVRKFEITEFNPPFSVDFKNLREKIIHYFPELRDKDYIVSWIDEEMDEIRITSSEELCIALQSMPHTACKLYVKLQSSKQKVPTSKKEGIFHSGIICDGCDGRIFGFRYKCIQCDDYDLCSQCESFGLHSDHCMIRISQPLQWSTYHGKRLLHHMKKFFKKTGANLGKEDVPDECPMKGKRCHEFSTPNVNIFPWLEAFAPYIGAFTETKKETQSSNNAGPSKDVPKEEDKKKSKTHLGAFTISKEDIKRMLDPFGLDIDIEISSDSSNQTNKAEQKEESKEEPCKDEDAPKKFPGEGRKLIDKTMNKESVSNATPVTRQDVSDKKATATADEWTIVDKSEASDISHASSVASSLNEIPENQVPLSAPSAPLLKESSSDQTLYPQLPKVEEKVYHPNPKIQKALETMIAMGFSNKGELLAYLLQAEDGNINKVLDLLQSTNK